MNYQQANEKLGNRASKNLEYATQLQRNGENIDIVHHETAIMTFKPNGETVVNCNKWRSKTTKDRLNNYLPYSLQIYQERGVWYIKGVTYFDGMTIGKRGGLPKSKSSKKIEKLSKKANDYCKQFIDELFNGNIPEPSAGDCWDCCMIDENGKTMGEHGNSGHIISHIKEKYYVPSLLVRACKLYPISPIVEDCIARLWNDMEVGDWLAEVSKRQILSSLRRYIKQQLGIAS